jgi:hypothetical protein
MDGEEKEEEMIPGNLAEIRIGNTRIWNATRRWHNDTRVSHRGKRRNCKI